MFAGNPSEVLDGDPIGSRENWCFSLRRPARDSRERGVRHEDGTKDHRHAVGGVAPFRCDSGVGMTGFDVGNLRGGARSSTDFLSALRLCSYLRRVTFVGSSWDWQNHPFSETRAKGRLQVVPYVRVR